MFFHHVLLTILSFSLLELTSAQTAYLPGLSTDVPQLSTFFTLLNSSQELYSRVQQGGVTILAPSNDAFEAYGPTQNGSTATQQYIDALLQYHIFDGVHPGASMSDSPIFLTSLLQNSSEYTNRTGGQVVEAKNVNGTSVIESAYWSTSNLTQADIFFQDGIMHIIDTVLTIPVQAAQSVAAANLTNFVALAEKVKLYSVDFAPWLASVEVSPDTTILAPNSSQYGSNDTDYDNLSMQQDLQYLKYHFINGTVFYSTGVANGTVYNTSAGLPVTLWKVGDDLYVNDAKITSPDLLQANGVIHVIDKPLDINRTDARPNITSGAANNSTQTSAGSGGLSTSVKAGVGAGAAVAVLLALGLFLCCFRVQPRQRWTPRTRQEDPQKDMKEVWVSATPTEGPYSANELHSSQVSELHSRRHLFELAHDRSITEMYEHENSWHPSTTARSPYEIETIERRQELE